MLRIKWLRAERSALFIFLCISRILFSLTQLTFLNAYGSYLSSALYNNKQMEGKRAHSAFHSRCTRPEIITELQRLTAALNQHAIATSSLSPIHVHTHLHTHHPWRQGHATKSLYFLVSARKAQQTQTTESVSL